MIRLRQSLGMAAAGLMAWTTAASAQAPSWTTAVDGALGRTGAMQPDSAYKFGFPRSDLQVSVGGVAIKPALALGSWLAFRAIGDDDAMAMGDIVLTEPEIGPVMRALQEGGVQETALHNHLRGESPHVMYMHIMARGNPVTIARAIRSALALSGTPLTMPAPASPTAPPAATAIDLDTAAIARTLGRSGRMNGGVYQVSVPRAEVIRSGNIPIPPSMGVATAINIQPTGGGRAVATGDFVLTSGEVSGVMRALSQGAIQVTALHSHMVDETPRLFFVHFWGDGDAVTVAQGLRAALDLTNSRPPH
jgi:Domain of Unknown Function (DUF1259)